MNNFFIVFLCILLAVPTLGAADDNSKTTIMMNIKSMIYHLPHCSMVKRCTKNCIKTTLDKAHQAGARACKVCHNKN